MSPLNINFSEVKGLELLPIGEYSVVVTKAEEGVSQNQNPKIDLTLQIEGGQFDGRFVFETLTFSDKSLFRVKEALIAMGYKNNFKGDVTASKLIGMVANVKIGIQKSKEVDPNTHEPYPDRNRIMKWKPVGSGGSTTTRDLA